MSTREYTANASPDLQTMFEELQDAANYPSLIRSALESVGPKPYLDNVIMAVNRFLDSFERQLILIEQSVLQTAEQTAQELVDKFYNPYSAYLNNPEQELDPSIIEAAREYIEMLDSLGRIGYLERLADTPDHEAVAREILLRFLYGVTVSDNRSDEWKDQDDCSGYGTSGWCVEAIRNLYEAVQLIADALWSTNDSLPDYARKASREELFTTVMRGVRVNLTEKDTQWWAMVDAEIVSGNTVYVINIYSNAGKNQQNRKSIVDTFIHEFGHIFNGRVYGRASNDVNQLTLQTTNTADSQRAIKIVNDAMEAFNAIGINPHRQSPLDTGSEVWADAFLYWVRNIYKATPEGQAFRDWMKATLPGYVVGAVRHSINMSDLLGRELPNGTVRTDGSYLNVRATPQLSGDVITAAVNGEILEVVGKDAALCKWYAVKSRNGYWGWVSADLVFVENAHLIPVVDQECLDWLNGKATVKAAPCS